MLPPSPAIAPEVIKEKELAYSAGYRTIDEIGRERISRAAKKIDQAYLEYYYLMV